MDKYYLGITSDEITLSVKIGTGANSYTVVNKHVKDQAKMKIAESSLDNVNITDKKIGKSENLMNCVIVVKTFIYFGNLPDDIMKSSIDNLFINYTLKGGFSGTSVFKYGTDDITVDIKNNFAVVDKPIRLLNYPER